MPTRGLSINHYLCPAGYGAVRFAGEISEAGATGIGLSVDALAELGTSGCRRVATDNGLTVTSLNSAGNFLLRDSGLASQQIDRNLKLVDAAAEIGAAVLVVVTGGLSGQAFLDDLELRDRNLIGAGAAFDRIKDAMAPLAEAARSRGVRLAIEPIHPMDIVFKGALNSIARAAELTGPDIGVGLMLDVYHSWWDPDLLKPPADVLGLQICGIEQTTRDMKPDRTLLGDGIVSALPIIRAVHDAAPDAFVEFEMFDRHRRGREVKDVITATMTAWRSIQQQLA